MLYNGFLSGMIIEAIHYLNIYNRERAANRESIDERFCFSMKTKDVNFGSDMEKGKFKFFWEKSNRV